METYGMQENGNYKVIITHQGAGGVVQGWVPETFQIAVTSQFSQPFGQGISNSTAGQATKAWMGRALTSQSMTAQVWEGSQPIEITLEIEFVAETDPKKEVLEPIKKLLKMTMPSKDGSNLLRPPGPKYSDIVDWKAFLDPSRPTGKSGVEGSISIAIGKFVYFDNVVIESVNSTFHSMMHSSGIPLRATVAVTFKTFFVPVSEDLDAMFPAGGGG